MTQMDALGKAPSKLSADRWPALDGLRGMMTIGVLLAHVRYEWLPGSILFMDTFFMMSSFFITRLLLKDWHRHGRLHLYSFFSRRIRRLLPALAIMVVTVVTIDRLLLPQPALGWNHLWGTVFYFENWLRALGIAHNPILGHTWSLSIEEQFYALWPLLLWLGLVLAAGSRNPPRVNDGVNAVNVRHWSAVLIGVALMASAWRAYLALGGAPYWRLYNGTDMRLDSLSLGALLAISFRTSAVQAVCRWLAKPWLVWLMLIVMMATAMQVDFRSAQWYVWQQPLCILLSLALLMAFLETPRRWGLAIAFQNPVSLYLGATCYGLYLWHYPLIELGRQVFSLSPLQVLMVCGPLCFALASLSYYLVELPVLGGRKGSAR